MGLSDIFDSFDAAVYRQHILSLQEPEIRQREIQKRRQLYGAGFKIAGGGALAPFTLGVSLVGSALGGRQYSIAEQKLAVIQQIMNENGWELHTETKRDVLIPLASTFVGMAAGGAVDIGIGHVVSAGADMCVQQGVHQVAHHTASETFGAAMTHPVDFVNGIEHGVGMGAAQAASVFHAGDMATNSAMATLGHAIPLGSSSATSMGMSLGHTGILDGLQHAAAWVASTVVKRSGDKLAGGRFRKGTMLDSAQYRNENISTKSPNQLRSLLRDYGVPAPVSATKAQLLKIINTIPDERLWSHHAVGAYLLFILALFGFAVAAFFHSEFLGKFVTENSFLMTVPKSAISSSWATFNIVSYIITTICGTVVFVFWAFSVLGLAAVDTLSCLILQAFVTGSGAVVHFCKEKSTIFLS
jgi:hypothetical protein